MARFRKVLKVVLDVLKVLLQILPLFLNAVSAKLFRKR